MQGKRHLASGGVSVCVCVGGGGAGAAGSETVTFLHGCVFFSFVSHEREGKNGESSQGRRVFREPLAKAHLG